MPENQENKEVGAVLKIDSRESEPGTRIKLPQKTEKSLNLEDKDIVQIKIRNMQDQETQLTRKVQRSGNSLRIYIPKKQTVELGLENKDLVDVFLSKK